MIYLLIILFPVSMAATCFLLRRRAGLVIAASVAAVLTQMILVTYIPLNQAARLLGVTFVLTPIAQIYLLFLIMIGGCAFVASWQLPQGENFIPAGLVTISLVCTTLLLQDLLLMSLLLVAIGIVGVLALVDIPRGAGELLSPGLLRSAITYLVMITLAGVLMYLSFVLSDLYQLGKLAESIALVPFILALVAGGFGIRLGLVPFHGWLPAIIDHAMPLVAVLVLVMGNATSVLLLIHAFQVFPVLLPPEGSMAMGVLRALALMTCLVGGIVALGQQSIRRTFAYLFLYDSGMIFYGIISASVSGLQGAIFTSVNAMFATTLIFVCLGMIERPDGRPPDMERRDLLRRWPVAGVGLLSGGLVLLGMPPLSGFVGKLLVYQSAVAQSWYDVMVLLGATACGGLALARLARDAFLGASQQVAILGPLMPDEEEFGRAPLRRLEPEARSTALLAVALLGVCLGIGLYPGPFVTMIREVTGGLPFVRAW